MSEPPDPHRALWLATLITSKDAAEPWRQCGSTIVAHDLNEAADLLQWEARHAGAPRSVEGWFRVVAVPVRLAAVWDDAHDDALTCWFDRPRFWTFGFGAWRPKSWMPIPLVPKVSADWQHTKPRSVK